VPEAARAFFARVLPLRFLPHPQATFIARGVQAQNSSTFLSKFWRSKIDALGAARNFHGSSGRYPRKVLKPS